MNAEEWKTRVLCAVAEHHRGDPVALTLLSQILEQQDEARQILYDNGLRWTGRPLVEAVREACELVQALTDG